MMSSTQHNRFQFCCVDNIIKFTFRTAEGPKTVVHTVLTLVLFIYYL